MSLQDTPVAERVHIAFFGCRNAGKSSLVNAFTGQDLAIVSQELGTTTDPVSKSMELLPMGPVLIIDTPGIDDEGTLGQLRIQKTRQVLNKTDIAILVVDAVRGKCPADEELLGLFQEKGLRHVVVYNKSDLLVNAPKGEEGAIYVSAKNKENIHELKELVAHLAKEEGAQGRLIADLLTPGEFVVLVVPIDSAAPKGRLILPQQQVIRDALEAGAIPVVCRETELVETLQALGKKPAMVVTDSQVFAKVSQETPEDIPLTSFSILMARYKGILHQALEGAAVLRQIKEGDRILIAEGCTHHRQCDDIGSVKLPRWIREFTGVWPQITLTSGTEFPEDLTPYRVVIHCGGCMLNQREVQHRYRSAAQQGVAITNYGTAIAYMKGILARITPWEVDCI